MPNDHVPATDTGTPKTLRDCQSDAVILAALMEGISILDDEEASNARCALIGVALEQANELANALDRLSMAQSAERRAAA